MTITLQQLTLVARQQLTAVTDVPALEAEMIVAHALQRSRSYLLAHANDPVSDDLQIQVEGYLQRRSALEPIAYLIGRREFWSLDLVVNAATLIPRPETELVVETVLAWFPDKAQKCHVADLGTGSGAIAMALASERPIWQIDATDISELALAVARKNAQHLDINNISFYQGNWCEALPARYANQYDVIVSNPPYLKEQEWQDNQKGLMFEPYHALVSGKDGLEAIRVLAQTASYYLKVGGYLVLEHGFLQAEAVRLLLEQYGYREITSARDLGDRDRITWARL